MLDCTNRFWTVPGNIYSSSSQYQDKSILQLHYRALTIPPPMKFDQNTTAALNKTYQFLDNRLSQRLTDIKSNVDQITEGRTTTLNDALTYAAFAMTFLNLAALSLVFFLLRDLLRHKNSHPPQNPVKPMKRSFHDVKLHPLKTNLFP